MIKYVSTSHCRSRHWHLAEKIASNALNRIIVRMFLICLFCIHFILNSYIFVQLAKILISNTSPNSIISCSSRYYSYSHRLINCIVNLPLMDIFDFPFCKNFPNASHETLNTENTNFDIDILDGCPTKITSQRADTYYGNWLLSHTRCNHRN